MTTMPTLTFAQVSPLMEAAIKTNITPALLGEAGIGKSSIIEDLARKFKTKVFTLQVNQLADRTDLTGVRPIQNEQTGEWQQDAFPHIILSEAIQYAKENPNETPIIFLDEFNRATPEITSAILSFITLRKIANIQFPDNIRFVVAGNDSGNVTSIDSASKTRFALYRVEPDLDTFKSVHHNLNAYIERVLNRYPDDLMAEQTELQQAITDDDEEDSNDSFEALAREFGDNGSFQQETCPRTISNLNKWLNAMGIDGSGKQEERDVLSVLIGDMSKDGTVNVLTASITAFVGSTTFAEHVILEITETFNKSLTLSAQPTQIVSADIRPQQDIINTLSKIQTVQEVNDLLTSLTEAQRINTFIWLIEDANVIEVNNKQAVMAYLREAQALLPDELEKQDIRNFFRIVNNPNNASSEAIEAIRSVQSPFTQKFDMILEAAL